MFPRGLFQWSVLHGTVDHLKHNFWQATLVVLIKCHRQMCWELEILGFKHILLALCPVPCVL